MTPAKKLRTLQQIAKRRDTHTEKPPTDGITSSADALEDTLIEIEARIFHTASTFHVTPADIIRHLDKRIRG